LCDVDEMTHIHAKQAQEWVTKTLHGVAGRVQVQESLPDNPTTPCSEDAEEEVESYTSAIANTGEHESGHVSQDLD
jgi:hypothetical protein